MTHQDLREFHLIEEIPTTWSGIVRPILRAWWRREAIRFRFQLQARGNVELSKITAELVRSREPNITQTILETSEVKPT